MKKIAFCFLIYDEINQEELWHKFFKGIDPAKYSIYIHSKPVSGTQKPLKYFEEYKLKNCIANTKWGDISLVRAHNLLFETALKDGDNVKFINVSQACIPMKPFEYIYRELLSPEMERKSLFSECNKPQCFPRCNSLLNFLGREEIYKSSEWFILDRYHANMVINNENFLNTFSRISCPEEHYYITLLKKLDFDNIVNYPVTYVNWEDEDDSSPKTYDEISVREYRNISMGKWLFARKFGKDCF